MNNDICSFIRAGIFSTHLKQLTHISSVMNFMVKGYGIRAIHKRFSHKEVKTTMSYTRVLNRDSKGVKSPADDL